jgi:hypothetical protein
MKGTVSAATLRDLIRDADRSGLFADADYGYLQITDVGDTRFTVRPDRAPARMVSVYALDIDDAYDMLTIGERANRQALRAFEQRLIDSVRDAHRLATQPRRRHRALQRQPGREQDGRIMAQPTARHAAHGAPAWPLRRALRARGRLQRLTATLSIAHGTIKRPDTPPSCAFTWI